MNTHDQQTAEYVSAVGGSPALAARVERMGKRIADQEAAIRRVRLVIKGLAVTRNDGVREVVDAAVVRRALEDAIGDVNPPRSDS